ncbi:MAG: TetR/AcrR family transcriptional regulator [Alphaproteobacteria bacterium]|nr:MAG: TetR/AcrR family transcriptional regulator [Alphaproteobacteria bacterium]
MPRNALTETEVDAGRARIVAAAHKIVGSDGLEALSMRSLADAVELTPGALYRYFVNKDQVIEAVFGGGAALDDRLLAIANSRVSDLNAVRQALQAYADFAFEDQVRFRSLFLKHYGPGGRAFHAHGSRRPGTEALKRRIGAAIGSGVFRKLDPDLALQVLWGAVHGVVALVLTAEGFPFAARTKLVDAAIENAIRGMTNPTRNRRTTG